MTLTDFILLVLAAPFLYIIGMLVAALLICLSIGGLIVLLEWLEKRKRK